MLVTDRGTVVAELRTPGSVSAEFGVDPLASGLTELVRRGRAVAGAPHDDNLYAVRPAAIPENAAAELLEAERGGR